MWEYWQTPMRFPAISIAASVGLLFFTGSSYATIHEAEDAFLSANTFTVANTHIGFSGTGFVDYPNPPAGGYIEWTITIAEAGSYDISFKYASGDTVNRPLQTLLDGESVGAAHSYPPTGAWTNYVETTVKTVSLSAGSHKIRLIPSTAKQGPNLDFLRIVPSPGSLPPVAADDRIYVIPGGTVVFDPRTNDSAGAGYKSLAIASQPGKGNVSINQTAGTISYTHTGTGGGEDTFRYSFADSLNLSSEATVTVFISSSPRVANATLTLPPDAPSSGALQVVDALPGLSFSGGVAVVPVPGSPKSLLVASIGGQVWMVPDTTVASPVKKEILNVASLSSFTRNRSIYSVVCHPDFATSGKIIVNYQGDGSRLPPVAQIPNLDFEGSGRDFDSTISCDLRVSQFTVSAANLNTLLTSSDSTALNNARNAVKATELPMINLAEQGLFHSINDCKFGSDGYLYVSFGDEGGQGEPGLNAQKITRDQFSSIIRIDVDRKAGNLEPNPHYSIPVNSGTGKANFSIPADNPYVGANPVYNGAAILAGDIVKVRTEIWATGLRNPFKFHIDPATGDIWVGDVGMDRWEEVSILRKGDNAGWSYWEGNERRTDILHAIQPNSHTPPVHNYFHANGNNSVTGGILYNGAAYTTLGGKYIFGDFGSGRIWSLTPASGGGSASVDELPVGGVGSVVDFEVDSFTGEILILQHGSAGKIRRLVEGASSNSFPQLLSQTGAFSDLATLTPNPGVIPYEPNLAFWSDHAKKSRYFAIKNTTDMVGYSRGGPWSFPEGMVFIKHFDMDLNRDAPGTSVKRLETRFLVRNTNGSYGVSYRWNDAGTEANLVAIGGVDFELNITEGGETHAQKWRVPSRGECLSCHTTEAGHALSFNTPQLNRDGNMGGSVGNFVELLAGAGYLEGMSDVPVDMPKHVRPEDTTAGIEERVRSYLAVNCAYCHQPGGGVPPSWDGRLDTPLSLSGILHANLVSEAYHGPNDSTGVPGHPERSAILNRIKAREAIGDGKFQGYSQMPPLASNVVDPAGVALIEDWLLNHANTAPTISAGTPSQVTEADSVTLGTLVGTVASMDPDVRSSLADRDLVRYEIIAGNEDSLFSLDPVSGELRVNGILDYSRRNSHRLTISVNDQFTANPGTTIHVLDVDLTDAGSKDSNGNGLPDFWEAGYSLSAEGPAGDTDNDGTKDFFEFLTGTNPEDGASHGPIPEIMPPVTPPQMILEWRVRNGMVLGEDYFLQASADLSIWTDLVPGPGYQILETVQDGAGFSKIRISTKGGGPRDFVRLSNMRAATALFNGSDFSGWEIKEGSISRFSVTPATAAEPAEIVGTANNEIGMLGTVATYSDFILEYDFRVEDPLNSGVQIRSFLNGSSQVQGYQIEIDPSNRAWSGGLYEQRGRTWLNDLSANQPAREAFIPDGWNHIRVVVQGASVRSWINGVPATDYTETTSGIPTTGFISLQVHQGSGTNILGKKVRFRNLFITPL